MARLDRGLLVAAGILALAVIAAVLGAQLQTTARREAERQGQPTLIIAPATLAATLIGPDEARPVKAEVLVRINFADHNPGGFAIAVRFSWSGTAESWHRSPFLRLLSRNDEMVDGRIERVMTVAVTIPDIGPPPEVRDEYRGSDFERLAFKLGVWRSAVMELTVKDPRNAAALPLLDQKLTLRISSRSTAAIIAAATVLAAVYMLVIIGWRRRREGIVSAVRSALLGYRPRVSPAHFQLILSTLLTCFAAVYFMGLTGALANVPSEILVALGIAATTVIAADILIKHENSEIVTIESEQPPPAEPRLRDLVSGDGQVEPSRMLMSAVTLVFAGFFAGSVAIADRMPAIPTWALVLLGVANSIYLVASFSSLSVLREVTVGRKIGDEVIKGVQAVMLGPEATRYDGFVRLTLTPNESPRTWNATLAFTTDDGEGDWAPITIKEGRSAESVFFTIVVRSDDPSVPEIDRDVIVPASGRQKLSFDIEFGSAGLWHLWATILQANRMVQVLEATATVTSGARARGSRRTPAT